MEDEPTAKPEPVVAEGGVIFRGEDEAAIGICKKSWIV
jgi:hypothetical protein